MSYLGMSQRSCIAYLQGLTLQYLQYGHIDFQYKVSLNKNIFYLFAFGVTYEISLDPDKDGQNARPDLDPNCLKLKELYEQNYFERNSNVE